MSNTSPAPDGAAPPHPVPPYSASRANGWTIERQLIFLRALAETRSPTRAAALVGKSVASVFRLCDHPGGYKFAAAVGAIARIHLRALGPAASTGDPAGARSRAGRAGRVLDRIEEALRHASFDAPDATAPAADACLKIQHVWPQPAATSPQLKPAGRARTRARLAGTKL